MARVSTGYCAHMLEFDSISVSTYEAASLAPKLTERSAAGWAVVAIVSAGSSVTAYLSREATAESTATGEPTAVSASSPDSAEVGPIGDADVATTDAGASQWSSGSTVAEAPAIDTPSTPEPEPVGTTPAAEPTVGGGASLADDVASLASQVADEPTSEPGGWAASGTDAASTAGTGAEPTPAGSTGAASAASEATQQAVQQTAASSAATAPAGWYADPSGRFELRYWDGSQWTEHVSRAGQQYTDPPVA